MATEVMTPEVMGEGEARDLEIVDAGQVLSTLSKAEIDIQIATAKRYPRSIKAFKNQAMELATLDEETAASMFYALPRGGKTLEGPSVRLAEVVGSSWGNLRYGARVVEIGKDQLTAQGMCFDLEKNIAIAIEVRRRITDRNGRRFNEDMITVTGNAACSIALRNAIFKVVPFAVVKGIYEAAREASIGKTLTMEQRRTNALTWFAKVGATEVKVLALLGRKGVEDITVDDLITLQGLRTAIKDGEAKVDDIFATVSTPQQSGPAPVGPDPLVAKAAAATQASPTPVKCAHEAVRAQLDTCPPVSVVTCTTCGEEVPGQMTQATADKLAAAQEREPGQDDDEPVLTSPAAEKARKR